MGIEQMWVATCDQCGGDGGDEPFDRVRAVLKEFLLDDLDCRFWLRRPDKLLCPDCGEKVLEEEAELYEDERGHS